ncbi:MAG: hypothetical protein ACJAT7_003469 [Psychromonas sp.]|jgi:hypothetical protein
MPIILKRWTCVFIGKLTFSILPTDAVSKGEFYHANRCGEII